MEKIYNLDKNVYEAAQERLAFVFNNYQNVYVCFSGGKDSSVLLNMVLDYKRKHNIKNKIAVLYRDYECDYTYTIKFVKSMIEENLEDIEPYWVCVPCSIPSPVSEGKIWKPWDIDKKDLWCREMPNMPYVINLDNIEFEWDQKLCSNPFFDKFGRWYANKKGGKTFGLNGMRSVESLHRHAAIAKKKNCIEGQPWTRIINKNLVVGMPLYDWTVPDVWHCNARFGYKYNPMYDLFCKANISVEQMRIGIPFLNFSYETLGMFKILEPQMYDKFIDRIDGVNFATMYGGNEGMGRRNKIILPDGYKNYEEYSKFLLTTLDFNTKSKYEHKLELFKNNCNALNIPVNDDTFKKFCGCILKNDYDCTALDISTLRYKSNKQQKDPDRFKSMMFGGGYR